MSLKHGVLLFTVHCVMIVHTTVDVLFVLNANIFCYGCLMCLNVFQVYGSRSYWNVLP